MLLRKRLLSTLSFHKAEVLRQGMTDEVAEDYKRDVPALVEALEIDIVTLLYKYKKP